jgi:hypothetical protein
MPSVGKIFISHASADKAFVDQLVEDLAAKSIPVWYDKLDLRIGDSVPGSINSGLTGSKYFAIVLSKASTESKWVREELNAALMKQVAQGGTFILPILIEDCDIPPLLAHRRYADFRTDYNSALTDLLSLWGLDVDACSTVNKRTVHPWPDIEMSDVEFVYLHSTRFDKFFKMSCSLDWTADRTIEYLTETLNLPWVVDVESVGMRWSFIYGLRFNDQSIPLRHKLHDAGVRTGSVIQISISGEYEDLYEKELREAFSPDKIYMLTQAILSRRQWLEEQVAARRLLTSNRLKEIADACFSHV